MEKLSVINGDAAVKSTPRKSRPKSKPEPSTPQDIKRSSNMSEEENNLATHVSLCHLRYQQLEQRLNGMEKRLDALATDISNIKASTQQGFSDIKLLLEQRNTNKQTQVIASAATIIVAILGAIGYWLSRT